jgi:hypothetical protein
MKTFTFAALVVSAATVGSMTVSPRATGGYLQPASGTATFTMYTGCGSPGTHPAPSSPPAQLTHACTSLRQVGDRLHRRDLAAHVRRRARRGRGRRVRPLLPGDGHERRVLAGLHGSVREEHRRQGHGRVPDRGQLRVLRADRLAPHEHARRLRPLRPLPGESP